MSVAIRTPAVELSALRLNLLRGGYLFVGLGLAITRWPLLPTAHALPLYEGITLCFLTALSLLALLGAWRPLRFLPVLLFEVQWKVLWLGLIAVPQAVQGGLAADTRAVMVNCLLVVVVVLLVPWRYAAKALAAQ